MKLADIEAIARALVRYIVVGGLAVVLHGYSRATYDLDLVIQLNRDNIEAAFKALRGLGYKPLVPITAEQFADAEQRRAWIEQKGMKVLNPWSDGYRDTNVDIFATEPFDFDAEYERSYLQEFVPGVALHVASLDTLIEMKRIAGRAKDLGDIEELQNIQEALRGKQAG